MTFGHSISCVCGTFGLLSTFSTVNFFTGKTASRMHVRYIIVIYGEISSSILRSSQSMTWIPKNHSMQPLACAWIAIEKLPLQTKSRKLSPSLAVDFHISTRSLQILSSSFFALTSRHSQGCQIEGHDRYGKAPDVCRKGLAFESNR